MHTDELHAIRQHSPSTILSVPLAPPPPQRSPDELLTDIQVAAETGLKRRTLQNWRSAGKGPPFVKLGASCRYRRADILAWIEAGRVLPGRTGRSG